MVRAPVPSAGQTVSNSGPGQTFFLHFRPISPLYLSPAPVPWPGFQKACSWLTKIVHKKWRKSFTYSDCETHSILDEVCSHGSTRERQSSKNLVCLWVIQCDGEWFQNCKCFDFWGVLRQKVALKQKRRCCSTTEESSAGKSLTKRNGA